MMMTEPCLQRLGFNPNVPTPRVTTSRIYPLRSRFFRQVATTARIISGGDMGMVSNSALAE